MHAEPCLTFYLNDAQSLQLAAREGILGRIRDAVTVAGWQTEVRSDQTQVSGPGYHLVYNRAVEEPNCLSLRRCYLPNYFRIEATNDRWDWPVANLGFAPRPGSHWFQQYWQRRLFKSQEISAQGHIFMPLQGRLLLRRHFQTRSPIEMISDTLAEDPHRQILATLHPRESYSAEEREALRQFGARFQLSDRPSMQLLASCDYVVTQNSAMGLFGQFALKPLVLFARTDFHHIAGSVPHLGIERAFAQLQQRQPIERYLHWFFKEQAICDVAEDVLTQITQTLRRNGWPL